MGIRGASRPSPQRPVYDEDFAERARQATRDAMARKQDSR